ncbi:copper amine oxidase-like protein [Fontibacillus phaseoli]|uniref:Copper amine oxidase-like protein n=1 Tax=Fontibacillus phaseoli TaxID=1416533 RepID=A0A369BEH6_9BACL|nr:copper amine oxidase N-terminal domain-containing protein [Fontibacillus phaseoli]RCX19635.1 copper amine oxidase-like protein [Fontibacillus phaseoli]
MMKKMGVIALSCILAMSLMSGAALAKNDDKGNKADKKTEASGQSKTGGNPVSGKPEKDKPETGNSNNNNSENEKQNKTNEKDAVTDATYTYNNRGPQGYKGLLHAIENVKDKPAGAVIAEILLSKYDAHLTEETRIELEAIVEADAALSEAAELLDQQGSVTDAVYVQKEAIKANVKNLEGYKKLGRYYKKLGKHGVKLFVNGEESDLMVSPVVQEGSTLVPFRTIAEALQAEVIWNKNDKTIMITKEGITVKLELGSKTAFVNGEKRQLEAPAKIVNGITLVPARFVSETLGAEVKWEAESSSVVVYEK